MAIGGVVSKHGVLIHPGSPGHVMRVLDFAADTAADTDPGTTAAWHPIITATTPLRTFPPSTTFPTD